MDSNKNKRPFPHREILFEDKDTSKNYDYSIEILFKKVITAFKKEKKNDS